MRNVLHSHLPEDGIADILAATAGQPALPPQGAPEWNDVRQHPGFADCLRRHVGETLAIASEPLPELTDELYADFHQTGERIPFERPYFERRHRLVSTAVAALVAGEAQRDRLTADFLRMLEQVADEPSWSVPAHVWSQPDGKDPMMIDLMAAETANGLAEMLVVFGDTIPRDLSRRIRDRLRIQVFENYLHRDPPFHWAGLPMNWNAVCHHGVLGAALAVEDDHALVAGMLARAARALPVFLSGFGDDGSTSEGPAYWVFGFGRFSELNARLEHRTRGELSLIEGDERIPRIARFAPLLTFSNGHFVNFSDGPATGWLSPSLLAYLGRRLADPYLEAHGIASYRQLAISGFAPQHQRVNAFQLPRTLLRFPSAGALAHAPEPRQPDAYFRDYGAVVARGTDASGNHWEFAAKAGHNAEHHNHNDCGSFIVHVNGRPVVREIGAPEYVGDYFNRDETRYTFLAARSLGHSVPLVNGHEQQAGEEHRANVVECRIGENEVVFVLDLTKAYPAGAGCRKLLRTIRFHKLRGTVKVTDDFELTEPGRFETVVILPPSGKAESTAGPGLLPVPGTVQLDRMRCTYNDHDGTPAEVDRIHFGPATNARSEAVGFQIAFSQPTHNQ